MRTLNIPQLDELEREMNDYIKRYAKGMDDTTWLDYAWRAKVIAMKKIIVLYIANGCQWEDEFVPFFWWSFHYSMWCKMALFYEKASEAFKGEELGSTRHCISILDLLPPSFTRAEFYEAARRGKFKTEPRILLHRLLTRKSIAAGKNGVYFVSK